MRTFLAVYVLALLFPLFAVAEQPPSLTVTLAQATDMVLGQGTDSVVLRKNLDIAREQYGSSVSQNSFSLSGSLGESATYGFWDDALLGDNLLASGFSQTPQAGLSLVGPLTSVGVTITPYVAASPLVTDFSKLSAIFSPGQPASTPGPTGNISLNANQVLWNGYPGGTGRAAVEKASLGLRSMELSTESGKLKILSAVTRSYFVMLGSQRNLAVKEQILEQQKALLDQISAVAALKQATEVDLQTAQINAESAEIDVRSGKDDLRIARIKLAQLMGWPREKEFFVSEQDDPQLPVASVEEAVTEALKKRMDIRQIELDRQAAAIDRALIQGRTTPTVSVTGGLSLMHDWQLGSTAGQGTVGLKVGLPILDAGAAGHQLEAAQKKSEVYAAQEEQLRAGIATDVEEAFAAAQISMQRLQVARLTEKKFALKLKLKSEEAKYNAATNQALLDASVDLANAESGVVLAQRNVQLAILQLRNAMGY